MVTHYISWYPRCHPVHLTFTMTLGELLQIVTMLVSVTAIIVGVRFELRSVRSAVTGLTERVSRHETTLFSMFGHLQRVIGIVAPNMPTPPQV